jgi:hypothetical protein
LSSSAARMVVATFMCKFLLVWRPERVVPDEVFDLVVFSVVMVFPSVPQLPSRNLPTLALFDAYGRSSRVKRRQLRRISAKAKAIRVGRMSQDQWTAGICQPLE